jgi:hypothetical protein
MAWNKDWQIPVCHGPLPLLAEERARVFWKYVGNKLKILG